MKRAKTIAVITPLLVFAKRVENVKSKVKNKSKKKIGIIPKVAGLTK